MGEELVTTVHQNMGEELGNYVHQNPPRSSFGTDRHTVHTASPRSSSGTDRQSNITEPPPVEFRDRQTDTHSIIIWGRS